MTVTFTDKHLLRSLIYEKVQYWKRRSAAFWNARKKDQVDCLATWLDFITDAEHCYKVMLRVKVKSRKKTKNTIKLWQVTETPGYGKKASEVQIRCPPIYGLRRRRCLANQRTFAGQIDAEDIKIITLKNVMALVSVKKMIRVIQTWLELLSERIW